MQKIGGGNDHGESKIGGSHQGRTECQYDDSEQIGCFGIKISFCHRRTSLKTNKSLRYLNAETSESSLRV